MLDLSAIFKIRRAAFQLAVKIVSARRPWVTEKLRTPRRPCFEFMLRVVKVMFPRPKSCYRRPAGVAVTPKIRSVDLATGTPSTASYSARAADKEACEHRSLPDAAMLLSKRSNSLQNLNTVRCKERKVDLRHPVKLAWVHRAHSQDSDYGSELATMRSEEPPDNEAREWCDSPGYSTQQKRKSLDIFLARSFIDPVDILSISGEVGQLVKPFASLSEGGADSATYDNDLISEDIWPPEDEISPAVPATSSRGEKRVTFAGEVHFEPRKMSAETRRLNFRNSRANFLKVHCSTFFDTHSSQNPSISRSPEPATSVSPKHLISCSSSIDSAFEVDRSQSPSGTAAPPATSRLASTTPTPSAKRKLKSCRSRSFHKSFDGSSLISNVETYSYVKATKPNPTDVVTVVSLLTSNEEMETEASPTLAGNSGEIEPKVVPATAPMSASVIVAPDKSISDKLIKPPVRDLHMKSGILKVKPRLTKSISLAEPLPVKPTLFTTENTGSTTDFRPLPENCLRLENVTVTSLNHVAEDKSNFSTSVDIIDCANQSQKEQECWSSFNKMTNKGLFVSFDTILRGLLTPTEYRLRKSEMLKQE